MSSGLMEAADAGMTVLAPSTELKAALFNAIERVQRQRGLDVWPTPRVQDFGAWLRERHTRRQFEDSSTPRCLTEVEERELWRRVVLESDASFLEPSGAARAARQARSALSEYGVPIRAVAAAQTEESQAFVDWNTRFSERCSALHCVSADQLLGLETPDLAEAPAWIESPLWRPEARRWLEHHAGAPLEPRMPEPGTARAPVPPRSVKASSPEAELAAIARWARANLQSNPEFRAWICVRDLSLHRPEAVDAFDAELARNRFSLRESEGGAAYAIAGGTPLAEYPPVRAALDLLAASSGTVAFEQFSVLLRSPELQGPGEASAAASLDAQLRHVAPSEAPLADWLDMAERATRSRDLPSVAALSRLRAAARTLAELTGSHPMSRWLSIWIGALERGPWALRHRWSSSEFQSAERFRELLGALAVGDRVFGSQSRAGAENILRRAARDTAFQIQTGVPPIWVSGQLTDPWLAYDGLWVSGCDEQRWPPPPDPIPLLPVALQRRHGVIAASAEAQLEFAERLQGRWLARARSCVFSRADPGDGRSAAASPLLSLCAPEPLEPPAEPQPHWFEQWDRAPTLARVIDERAPAFSAAEKTQGVSTIKAQSLCPFRGFAQTRLDARPLERPLPGFNERERGELLHDALQRIWSAVGDSTRLAALAAEPAEFARLLSASAGHAIAKLCERRDPGRHWRGRELTRLEALLQKWFELERARTPFAIDQLESGAETARHAGLDFSVRVDRIDRLPDGSRVLIDYKTGFAGADWRGDRPDNPQLPIYALLHRAGLVAAAYGKVNAAECTFIVESERDRIFPRKRASDMEGLPNLAALLDVWAVRIERLAQEFADGKAAVDPTASACRSCRLQGLCRVPSSLDDAEGE